MTIAPVKNCPVCDGDEIKCEGETYDHGSYYTYMYCDSCLSEWREEYVLNQITITNNRKENKQ